MLRMLIRQSPCALQTMYETGADFTNTFRWLSEVPLPAPSAAERHPSTAQNSQSSGPDQSTVNGADASTSGMGALLQWLAFENCTACCACVAHCSIACSPPLLP